MPANTVKGFNVNGATVQYDYESLSDRLLKSSIGEIYSSSNTYKVDEYVLYAGQLYRCIVEVTTPQNFDSSKWEAVSVGNDLGYIKKYFCINDGIKQALLNLLSHVAYTDEHGQDYYDELEAELFKTADLVSISAVFNQGQNVIYDTDSLDTLKQYLVVTATYDDSSTGTVTAYMLSGTLTVGTSTITVSYGGKMATFDVAVTDHNKWSYNISELTKVTGTCGNNANAACGMTLEYAGSSNPYRRSFMLDDGETSIAIQVPNSMNIESQTSDYYPVKVPEGATSITVSITPNTQYIQLLTRQLDNGVYSTYATVGPSGYNQGPVTKTFAAAPDNVYVFVTTKYDSAGTSYPVEPTGLDITFTK